MIFMKIRSFKKRTFIFAYLAYEVIALAFAGSASAQILDRIKFEVPQHAVMAKLPTEPGRTRLIVTSNSPFAVIASGAVGDYNISVMSEGHINTTSFGSNAQLPGPASLCAAAVSPVESIIYQAEQKTARSRGSVLSQAVMIEIRYDSALAPDFAVKTQVNSQGLVPAAGCAGPIG